MRIFFCFLSHFLRCINPLFRGLYRGFWISCSCIFIYRGLYFGLYDTLKPALLGTNADWISTFLLGWAVTIVSGISAYPLDTVKRQESILCRQIKIEAAFISDFKYDLKWIKEYDQDTDTIILIFTNFIILFFKHIDCSVSGG